MEFREYDVAVLGGGPGGTAAALRAAKYGARVCCVEAGLPGGTCLNSGCIPGKALLHASEIFDAARRGGEWGISANALRIEESVLRNRITRVVEGLRRSLSAQLKTAGVEWIHGRGVLESPGKLRVEKNKGGCVEVRAKAIILATGSQPVRPEEFGWEAPQFVTSEEVLRNFRLPRSAVILGGGAIGCELATIYSGLGVPCTLLERQGRLLPEFPDPAGREVARALQNSGVDVWTNTNLTGAQDQGAELRLTTGDGRAVSAEQAVVAVGRKANFSGIDAEALGLKMRDGVIQVNSRAETSLPGVYAVGDVAQRKQYAHLAMRMGEVAADNALGREVREEALWVPQCVYTRPQVARVGLDERQVRRYSNDVRVAEFSYRATGMARATGQTAGQVTLVLTGAGQLWGASVVGAAATELIHELTLAAGCGVPLKQWATMIHAHPTFSEVISEAARAGLSSEPLR